VPQNLMMKVAARSDLTSRISAFDLVPPDGARLPPAEPGAHIGVRTPAGAMRSYSLVHPSDAPASYTIAVRREDAGRGGSRAMHDLAPGDGVEVRAPVNGFPLGSAPSYLLIAGGIGVTPIYAMAQALVARRAEVRMIYCARSAEDAAFLSGLRALLGDRLTAHFDAGDPDEVYDFWDDFETPTSAHVYCCGPAPLMEEIRAISGHWPDNSIHFEDFAGVAAVRADDRPFEVTLRRSGRTLTIPADASILEALRSHGVATVSSCESGTCGTCKCGLIAGDVDHRDMVLMDEEKADRIMICVSRAVSGGLILDL